MRLFLVFLNIVIMCSDMQAPGEIVSPPFVLSLGLA